MHSTTRGVKQLTSSPSLKRGGQKDDEEVFIETCQNCSVSLGSSSRQKVRSSRPSVGRFPLGLDDLTLWHEELPDFLGNASFLTFFAENFMEEWTRMKLGSGREKRGTGGERSRTHDFSVLSGPASAEPVASPACLSGILDTGAAHNAVSALLYAAADACFVFWLCVAVLVCKLLVLVCMCVVLRVVRAVVCCSVAIISRILEALWEGPRV